MTMKNTKIFYKDASILIKNDFGIIENIKNFNNEKTELYEKLKMRSFYNIISANTRYLPNKIDFYKLFHYNDSFDNEVYHSKTIDLNKWITIFKTPSVVSGFIDYIKQRHYRTNDALRYALTIFGLILTSDVYQKDIKTYIYHKDLIEQELISKSDLFIHTISTTMILPYSIITNNRDFIKLYNKVSFDMIFSYVSKVNLPGMNNITKENIIKDMVSNSIVFKVENAFDFDNKNISKSTYFYVYKNILSSIFKYHDSENIQELGKIILNEKSIMNCGGYLAFAIFYNKFLNFEATFDVDYFRKIYNTFDRLFDGFDFSFLGSCWKRWSLSLPVENKITRDYYSPEHYNEILYSYFIKKYFSKIIKSLLIKSKFIIYGTSSYTKEEIQELIFTYIIIIQKMVYSMPKLINPSDKSRWIKHVDKDSKKIIRMYFKLIRTFLDRGYISTILKTISTFDDHPYLNKDKSQFSMKILEFYPIITQTLNYIYKYYNKPLDLIYEQADSLSLLNNRYMIINYFVQNTNQTNSMPILKNKFKCISRNGAYAFFDLYMNYIVLNYYVKKYDNEKGKEKLKLVIKRLMKNMISNFDKIDILFMALCLIDFDSALDIINNNSDNGFNPLINDYYGSKLISHNLITLLSWVGFQNNKIISLAKISVFIGIDCMVYAKYAIDKPNFVYRNSIYNWYKKFLENFDDFSEFHFNLLNKIYEINPNFKIYETLNLIPYEISSITFSASTDKVETFFINKIIEAKNKVACKNAFIKLLRKTYGRNNYHVRDMTDYLTRKINEWNQAHPPKKTKKRTIEE